MSNLVKWLKGIFRGARMPNWPGRRYLGPGNPLEAGEPVDSVDRIAKLHDIAYEYARSKKDIFHADKVAVAEFATEFASEAKRWKINWGALAGTVGLCTKNLVEGVLQTTLYPWTPGRIPRNERLALSCVREMVKIKHFQAAKRGGARVDYGEYWSGPEGAAVLEYVDAYLERERAEYPGKFVALEFCPQTHAERILKCLAKRRHKRHGHRRLPPLGGDCSDE